MPDLIASSEGSKQKIQMGSRISLHFALLMPGGEEIDTTRRGKPAALKCAKGRYYYTCCMAGGDASQKCSFYARSAVAQQEADRLRAIDENG